MADDANTGPVIITHTCACHDSHGYDFSKDGTVVEKYEIVRCPAHRDRPSVYGICTPEEKAVLGFAVTIFKAERDANSDRDNTMTRCAAFLTMQQAQKECRKAVQRLLAARTRDNNDAND